MSWILSAFADEAGPSTEDQIKALQRAGLKWVDLRMVDGFNITTLPLDKAREVRRKLDGAGIKVGMFGSPIGKIQIDEDFDIDLQKLSHLAMLSDILDCKAVRIFSYYNKSQLPKDQFQAETIKRLLALRELAAKTGMVLYHENERAIFGEKDQDVRVIARELRDNKHFKIIFDFDNYNHVNEDVWNNWQNQIEITDAFHLKDSDANHHHVPVGQGAGQIKRILADAQARGWSGMLSIEPHLKRSAAVMATGPGGQPNQQFDQMSTADSFHVAAQAATGLLNDLGVAWA